MSRTAGDFHGTINGYSYHGCRLDCCVQANAAHQLEMTRQRAAREVPEHVHGTRGGYTNYKCPCGRCRDEYLRTQAVYRERRKQRA